MTRVNYDLILIYSLGFKPKDVIRQFGYSRSSAYRFYRIFREARKRAVERVLSRDSGSPDKERRVNDQGALKAKRMRVAKRELAKTRTGNVEVWIDDS